jgi:hypothetical protein
MALTGNLLRSLPTRTLAPFVAEWPGPVQVSAALEARAAYAMSATALAPTASAAPNLLPVMRCLPSIAANAHGVGASLAATLCRHAPHLRWRQSYSAGEVEDEFLRNYGWTEIVGLAAPVTNERIACGFLLLGPATLYPRHRHEAEEIYVPLSGTADWQQGSAGWRERTLGTIIHHASEEPHAMRSGAQPLLALYLWRSNDLNQKARLDPA